MFKRSDSFNIHALLYGLVVLVVITGTIRLLATGHGGSHSKRQLTFWNGFTGPDGVVMLKMIEDFNRLNPDVEVRMQRIPWATYYNKLTVAGSDGRGPEIFISHADALARIRRAGFVDDASDLFTGSNPIDPKDFDQKVREYVCYSGKFQGVPLDIHPQGMYCDVDMFRKAGLVDENGNAKLPANKEEFLNALQKTTVEAGGELSEKQWGFALTFWGANFRSLVPQFGGDFLDSKGNAVMNSPANIKALEFVAELTKSKKVPPPDNGLGWFGFRTKRVAMVWDGVFMLGDLLRVQDVKYAGAPIPQIGPRPGTVANSHVMCLKKGMPPEVREAAVRFIKYVSDHSIEWAAAGQVPARLSVRGNPAFAKLQVQHAFSLQVPNMVYPPKTPVIFEYMLAMDQAAEAAVRGLASPKEALDKAQKIAQDAIDRDRKEHPEDQQ